MLDDTQRKVLRILFNLYRYETSPLNLNYLERFAQRTAVQLQSALRELHDGRFIDWDPERVSVKVLYLGEVWPSQPVKPWWEYD